MNDPRQPRQAAPAGLCATCRHAAEIVSAKGSRFLLCELSKTDDRFAKYPPLPVLACAGHAARGGSKVG